MCALLRDRLGCMHPPVAHRGVNNNSWFRSQSSLVSDALHYEACRTRASAMASHSSECRMELYTGVISFVDSLLRRALTLNSSGA
eukprot:7377135-Prymnesium_polylepis.1